MIYIGKFLHATDQQRTRESNRWHGEFNLIIEADTEKKSRIDRESPVASQMGTPWCQPWA